MKFTEEQRKIIDKLLAEADEIQKLPDSRYYTVEEVWKELMEQYHKDLDVWIKNKGDMSKVLEEHRKNGWGEMEKYYKAV